MELVKQDIDILQSDIEDQKLLKVSHNSTITLLCRVFKLCKQYLVYVQNSVFEGEISKADLFKLEHEINGEIDQELDSVIIFSSRHERWLVKEIYGKSLDDPFFI